MNFVVFDADGRIVQSNKVYSPEGYAERLNAEGFRFLSLELPDAMNPAFYYVRNGEAVERPIMPVQVSATTIKAGTDPVVFQNIPSGAHASCSVEDMQIGGVDVPANGLLELPLEAPGLYRIVIVRWPYRDYEIEIEAV